MKLQLVLLLVACVLLVAQVEAECGPPPTFEGCLHHKGLGLQIERATPGNIPGLSKDATEIGRQSDKATRSERIAAPDTLPIRGLSTQDIL